MRNYTLRRPIRFLLPVIDILSAHLSPEKSDLSGKAAKQEVGKVLRYLPAPTQSPSMSLAEREFERRRGEVAYIEQLDRIVDPPDGISVTTREMTRP